MKLKHVLHKTFLVSCNWDSSCNVEKQKPSTSCFTSHNVLTFLNFPMSPWTKRNEADRTVFKSIFSVLQFPTGPVQSLCLLFLRVTARLPSTPRVCTEKTTTDQWLQRHEDKENGEHTNLERNSYPNTQKSDGIQQLSISVNRPIIKLPSNLQAT